VQSIVVTLPNIACQYGLDMQSFNFSSHEIKLLFFSLLVLGRCTKLLCKQHEFQFESLHTK